MSIAIRSERVKCASLGVMEVWYESYEVWLSVIWWGEGPDVVNSHVVMKGSAERMERME
jgi:hypothetical protein